MKKEIEQIIEKNLPKQMGDVLQKRFNELEEIEKNYEKSHSEVESLKSRIDKLVEQNDILKKAVLSADKLLRREKEIEERERNYEVTILRERLKTLELSKNEIVRLSEIVFKQAQTPPADINIWGNIPVADNFGNIIQHQFNAGGTIKSE